MDNKIKNKNILITGATGGVGSNLVKKLYRYGAHLLLLSENLSELEHLKKTLINNKNKNGSIEYLAVNFNNIEEVENSINKIIKIFDNSIDILINVAGVGYHCSIEKIVIEELKEVFNINAISPIIITSRLLPIISKSSTGQIISISSILGSRSMGYTGSYTASKHALTGFMKVLRIEATKIGVRTTLIEPGAIETNFIKRTHDFEAKEYFKKRKLNKIPPEVIADWIVKIIESEPVVCPEVIQIMPKDQII